jgi:uncharacterized membrane protein
MIPRSLTDAGTARPTARPLPVNPAGAGSWRTSEQVEDGALSTAPAPIEVPLGQAHPARGTMSSPRTIQDTARLQAFSDAVFALSATLLVVSLEVPDSYKALLETVARFPAFAIGFAALISLWVNHRQFFAAYPLGDGWTVALNSLLLLIVLLYVYPLKLLTELIAEHFLGAAPNVSLGMGPAELRGLFLIFGSAVFATLALLTALHARAWQLRDALGLDQLGRYELRQEVIVYAALALVPVLSLLAAAFGLGLGWGLPGWLYLLAPAIAIGQQLLAAGPRRQLRQQGSSGWGRRKRVDRSSMASSKTQGQEEECHDHVHSANSLHTPPAHS